MFHDSEYKNRIHFDRVANNKIISIERIGFEGNRYVDAVGIKTRDCDISVDEENAVCTIQFEDVAFDVRFQSLKYLKKTILKG